MTNAYLGINDKYGNKISEGDTVNVYWMVECAGTEHEFERIGKPVYKADGISAAWFIKFDKPIRTNFSIGGGMTGAYECEYQPLMQTGEEDSLTFEVVGYAENNDDDSAETQPVIEVTDDEIDELLRSVNEVACDEDYTTLGLPVYSSDPLVINKYRQPVRSWLAALHQQPAN